MCARWARLAYEDSGYDVPPIDLPEIPRPGGEYVTPPSDKMVALKLWYDRLATSSSRVLHAYAMMVYHFAMRNGDVDRLTLKELPFGGREYVIPGGGSHHGLRHNLNRQMRALGFDGSKGIYELRKACGDAYARKLGIDMARAILGHRLVTGSTAHYVDGSGPIVPTIWG